MYVINVAVVRDIVNQRSCAEGKNINISQITDARTFLNTRAQDMGISAVSHRPMAWHVVWLLKEHLWATKGYTTPLAQQADNLLDDLFVVQPDGTLFPAQMTRVLRLLTKVGWLTQDRRRRALTILPEDLVKAERLRKKPGYRTSKCCVVANAAKRQWRKKVGCSFTSIYVDGPKGSERWQDTSDTMVDITHAFDKREALPPLPLTLTFVKTAR